MMREDKLVIESFYTNNESIVLLGDSILKNNSYVEDGKGIDNLLIEKSKLNVYSYAEDGSNIIDVYSQLDKIPLELNQKTTTIYLSIGGNDILTQYVDKMADITNITALSMIFSEYVKLTESIKTRFNLCKVVLLDIYYPKTIIYKIYHSLIKKWNEMIYNYANSKSNMLILKISDTLILDKDLIFNIEPSTSGGEKIVNSILSLH
jgi:hypothetical protein